MVTPDESRIIPLELLAKETGCDVTKELAASNAARLEDACKRWGLAGNKNREGFLTGSDFNDYLFAYLIVPQLKKFLRFDRQVERFYRYSESDRVWSGIKERDARLIIAETLAHFVKMPGHETLSVVYPSERRLRGLAEAVKSLLGEDWLFTDNPFKPSDKILVPVLNGVVTADLLTGEVSFRAGHLPEDMSLYLAPLEYQEGAEPWPEMLVSRMLLPAMKDEATVKEFLFDAAWAVLGGARQPCIIMIVGAGGSGKGEFVRMIQDILGPALFSSKPIQGLYRAFGLAGLVAKRVLIFQEESAMLKNEGAKLCKNLTGDDALDERALYSGEDVTIAGRKVILTTSNDIPYIDLAEDRDAWDRRLRPYFWGEYERKEVIPNFRKLVFEREGPQLLACLMEGMRRRMKDWLDYKSPALSGASRQLLDRILLRSCPVSDFLSVRLCKERGSQISGSELLSNFNDFMRSQGQKLWRASDFNSLAGKQIMRIFGVPESHSVPGAGRGFRGLRWRTQSEMDND